ncbi:MAG: hypothetical protein AUG51_02810 [Acidobacteria bacterium 13_1_20CM_3_53_8]|nr:MAG: hypothetical protein AUG51_02810 [Acidobacteria bacterium 13_1_20CM_3_53_8]
MAESNNLTPTKRRLPSLEDLKKVVTFKTFYLIIVVALIGIVLILIDALIFPYTPTSPPSPFKGIFLALGATLLTTSTVSLLFELFMRLDVVDFMTTKVTSVLPPNLTVESSFSAAGLVEFQVNRTSLDFSSIAQNAPGYLKIIGFNANDILSPPNIYFVTERLKTEREFSVKILIINPWSLMAQRRSEAKCYKSQPEFLRSVWSVYQFLHDLCEKLRTEKVGPARFDVRLYDTIPSLSMIIDSYRAMVTPILNIRTGGASPFFIVDKKLNPECPYEQYQGHFDDLWKNADPITDINFDSFYRLTIQRESVRVTDLPSSFKEWLERKLLVR